MPGTIDQRIAKPKRPADGDLSRVLLATHEPSYATGGNQGQTPKPWGVCDERPAQLKNDTEQEENSEQDYQRQISPAGPSGYEHAMPFL